MFNKRSIILAILFFAATLCTADDDNTSPSSSITMAELRDHIFYLASDELGGRVTGTKGCLACNLVEELANTETPLESFIKPKKD